MSAIRVPMIPRRVREAGVFVVWSPWTWPVLLYLVGAIVVAQIWR